MKLLVQASACTYHEKREEINFKTSVSKQHKERLRQKREKLFNF